MPGKKGKCMFGRIGVLSVILLILFSSLRPATAHEMRPAYLEFRQIDSETFKILWKVPAKGEWRLSLHVLLPASCVSDSKSALAIEGARIERWTARCQGGLAGKRIEVDGLAATMTDVLVRIERLDIASQVQRLTPLHPYFVVDTDPKGIQIAKTYLTLGSEHILMGFDHLLFLLALLILIKGKRRLIGTVTAFTLAHSLTLAMATLGFAHIPQAPVEAVIALSIAFVAAEIIHAWQGKISLTESRPWIVAFSFGLLHGLGFAGALFEIGLPQREIPLALLMFNLGVELGQLIFIAIILVAIALLRRLRLVLPSWAKWISPYAIGSMAMFWVIQRISNF